MDALVVILLCGFLALTNMQPNDVPEELKPQAQQQQQVVQLNPRLNPSMYHDDQAFMLIANELGFY